MTYLGGFGMMQSSRIPSSSDRRLAALWTITVSTLVMFHLPIAGAQEGDDASCSTTQASARTIQLGETVAGAQEGEPQCIYSLVIPGTAGTLTIDFEVAGRGIGIVCAGQGTIEGDDFCGTSQSDSCWQIGSGILSCDLAPAPNGRDDFWIAVTDYWAIGPDPFTLVADFVSDTSSSSPSPAVSSPIGPDDIFGKDDRTLAIFELNGDMTDGSGNDRDPAHLGGTFLPTPHGMGLKLSNTQPAGIDWSAFAGTLTHPYTIEMVLTPSETRDFGKLFSFSDEMDNGWYYSNEGFRAYPGLGLGSGKMKADQVHYLAIVSTALDKVDVYFQGERVGSTLAGFAAPPQQAIFFRDDSSANLVHASRGEQLWGVVDGMRISHGMRSPVEIRCLQEQLSGAGPVNDEGTSHVCGVKPPLPPAGPWSSAWNSFVDGKKAFGQDRYENALVGDSHLKGGILVAATGACFIPPHVHCAAAPVIVVTSWEIIDGKTAAWHWMANDPPDPNYRELVTLQAVSPISPTGPSRYEHELANFITLIERENANITALMISLERASGAIAENSTNHALAQAQAVELYLSNVQTNQIQVRDAAEVVEAEFPAFIAGRETEIQVLIQRVKDTGFTSEEREQILAGGASRPELDALLTELQQLPASAFVLSEIQAAFRDFGRAADESLPALDALKGDAGHVVAALAEAESKPGTPFFTRFGVATLAVAILLISLVAYGIGRHQGRKGT